MRTLSRRGFVRTASGLLVAAGAGYALGKAGEAQATTQAAPLYQLTPPPAYDPIDTNWSNQNFPAGTVIDSADPNTVFLQQPPAPAFGLSARVTPINLVGPYDIQIGFRPQALPVDYQKMGLVIWDSRFGISPTAGHAEILQLIHNSGSYGANGGWGIDLVQWNSWTSLNAKIAEINAPVTGPLVWLRVQATGRDPTWFRNWSWSPDGDPNHWESFYSESYGTWLNETMGGFAVAADNSSYPCGMEVWSWINQ